MRVVFLGTPETAVPALRSLLDHSHEVHGVFTQPDRPAGRGQKQKPGSVKVFARERGIPVYQPENIRQEAPRGIIEGIRPDFIIVVAYGQILPGWLLQSARLAPLNIHFSLLPRYRGAAPVARAILNGDSTSGVSIMIMQEALDSGPVLAQRELAIASSDTTGEVEAKLAEIGAALLIDVMKAYACGSIDPVLQDEARVTWAPRISKSEAGISWNDRSADIHNRIRAMNPRPGAHTLLRGEPLHIWSSVPVTGGCRSGGAPGTFLGLDQDGMLVLCGDGNILRILELQKPSKRRVSGREFASGLRLQPGDTLFQT